MKKIVVLLLLLAGGAAWMHFSDGGATEYVFRTATLESGNIVAKVTATGKLSAVTVVEVGTQVSGTVKEIY
ncbi:MAG: efflux RND transporter periplasmic adaptor subunit, partial [Synergistaceae bacterium]|nr:efflux RND transporter periplasmic adaptor subunit [Synergistaceae bacterium]